MSNDVFIKINGITGESEDAAHPGEIQVENWTWKMSQRSSMMSGSGGGAGKASVEDLVFFHQVDRASPNLMSYCLTGKHIDQVVLTMRKAGGVPLDFLQITMSDVIVTGGDVRELRTGPAVVCPRKTGIYRSERTRRQSRRRYRNVRYQG